MPRQMMGRRRLILHWSAVMPKSRSFCTATGLPERIQKEDAAVRGRLAVLSGFLLCAFTSSSGELSSHAKEGAMALRITSPEFSEGEVIPKKFTCDAQDVSPKLEWKEPPANTQSIALLMDDPDATGGTWVHWVLFDLSANTRELPEGVAKQEQLASGARQGRNDFGAIGYN